MRIYTRTLKCSETFPATFGESWDVMQGGKLAERWFVLEKHAKSIVVQITEYFNK